MVIQYNSRQKLKVFPLPISPPNGQAGIFFEVKFWVNGKVADNLIITYILHEVLPTFSLNTKSLDSTIFTKIYGLECFS